MREKKSRSSSRGFERVSFGWTSRKVMRSCAAMKTVASLSSLLVLGAIIVGGCSGASDSTSPSGSGDGPDGGDVTDDGGQTGSTGDAASSGGDSGGGSLPISTDVRIIVEPNGNHASELVDAINAAKTSIYMTMYQIDNTSIVDAIKAQESNGLDVKIVLDGSTTNKTFNTPAYNAFNGVHSGTAVWSSTSFTYTHQKTVILDGKEAWIMTMNLNQSSPDDDREYLAIDDDAADVAEATTIFQADFAKTAVSPSGNLVVAPGARPDLVALIQSATKSIDIEAEEFSDTNKNGIVDAVAAAAQSGIKVRLVIANNSPDATQPAAIAQIKAAGAQVVKFGGTSSGGTASHPYVAAKALLVDCSTGTCARGYTGSENFTAASVEYNRELGVIFGDATELGKIYTTIGADFAAGTPQ